MTSHCVQIKELRYDVLSLTSQVPSFCSSLGKHVYFVLNLAKLIMHIPIVDSMFDVLCVVFYHNLHIPTM